MKKFFKLVSLVFCMIIVLGVAACGESRVKPPPGGGGITPPPVVKEQNRDGWVIRDRMTIEPGSQLRIKFFKGGYGSDWITEMAKKFEKDYGNNVTVTLIPSTVEAQFTTLLPQELDGTPEDIYICHNIPWEQLAVRGRIMNLDNLYNSVIYYDNDNLIDENGEPSEDGEPTPIRFVDRIAPSSLNSVQFWNAAENKYSYYKVPQVQGSGGLAFNKTIFDEHGWKIPATYDELLELCQTIVASGTGIHPFVWTNAEAYLWDSMVYDWWVQRAGIDEFNRFMAFEDKNVFNPAEYPHLKAAWSQWYNLIAKNKNFSHPSSLAFTHLEANMAFAAGQGAMMPATCWIGNEIGFDTLEAFNVEIGLMPTPLLADAKKDDDGNPIRVAYDLAGKDSIIVAQKGKNRAIAAEFLKWMSEEENALIFPRETNGLLLAMRYDFNSLIEAFDPAYEDGLDKLDEMSPYFQKHYPLYLTIAQTEWAKNMFTILNTSTRFNLYSSSPMVYAASTPLSPYPEGNYYGEAFERAGTAEEASRNPDSVFDAVWTMINREWENMQRAVGL